MSHVGQAAAEAPRESEGGFLALMRHRNYALLWTGQLISQTGDRLQWVVISLWVYAQTSSALSVSYAIMALMIGPAVVGVFAGAVVDRFDRRKILIYSDLLRAVLVFAIPDLMGIGLIWVYLDLFLMSAVSAFFRPAMFAAVPESVPKHRLMQANAFFASMDTSTEIFGPALAGIVTAWRGFPAAIYINAVSYLVSAVFVSALQLRPEKPVKNSPISGSTLGILQSVREGFRYILGDQIQIALLAILLAGQWVVGLSALQTPIAKGVLAVSDQQYGWFQSIWGIGFLSASLVLGWFGSWIPRGQTIIFAYLLWSLAAAMMGLSPNYGALLVTGFWVGFANMLMFVCVLTTLMEHTPTDKIGRTMSTRQIALALVRVIALVGFGWFADLTGVRVAILTMAGVSFAGTLLVAVGFPALWQYGLGRVASSQVKDQTAGKELASSDRAASFVARYLEAHADPEFNVSEQRFLSSAVLIVVFVGWLLLLVRLPFQALGVFITVGVTVLIASLARSTLQRLRVASQGHQGPGGTAIPSSRREE